MSYIKIIEKDEAEGRVKEVYEELITQFGGRLPPVMQCMSLNPEAIPAVVALNHAITFGASTLTRVQEEMIATTTSIINECDY
jgi:hypothetical protein